MAGLPHSRLNDGASFETRASPAPQDEDILFINNALAVKFLYLLILRRPRSGRLEGRRMVPSA